MKILITITLILFTGYNTTLDQGMEYGVRYKHQIQIYDDDCINDLSKFKDDDFVPVKYSLKYQTLK